jgi:hypothetical protein
MYGSDEEERIQLSQRHAHGGYDECNYNSECEDKFSDKFSGCPFLNQKVPKIKEGRFLRVVSGTLKSALRELLIVASLLLLFRVVFSPRDPHKINSFHPRWNFSDGREFDSDSTAVC